MTFDLILNIAWGLVGLAAWLTLITRTRARGWHRRLTVLLAIIALFPCISASDDLMSLRTLTIPGNDFSLNTPSGSGLNSLPRMLEALESSQVSHAFVLLLTLLSFGTLGSLLLLGISRQEPVLAGRSPPFAS